MKLHHVILKILTITLYTIYGEWCGGNIQKGVGISNLQNLSLSLVLKFHQIQRW
jgi:hypothetical protein